MKPLRKRATRAWRKVKAKRRAGQLADLVARAAVDYEYVARVIKERYGMDATRQAVVANNGVQSAYACVEDLVFRWRGTAPAQTLTGVQVDVIEVWCRGEWYRTGETLEDLGRVLAWD